MNEPTQRLDLSGATITEDDLAVTLTRRELRLQLKNRRALRELLTDPTRTPAGLTVGQANLAWLYTQLQAWVDLHFTTPPSAQNGAADE